MNWFHVAQDLRPADALWHAEITRQIRPLLEDPDVEDPASPARQRIEYLWGLFRELYILKVTLPGLLQLTSLSKHLDARIDYCDNHH